jgi:hypothetical protein
MCEITFPICTGPKKKPSQDFKIRLISESYEFLETLAGIH